MPYGCNLDFMQALTRDELLALLRSARAASERDWLLILIAFHHGLRVSEVIRIKREDIRGGELTVCRLKGSQKTVQPLVSHAEPLLDERSGLLDYLKSAPISSPLFKQHRSTAWRRIQRHAHAAGIAPQKASVRALKHSLATQTIDKAGVKAVQLQLGHKSAKNTLVYTDLSPADAAERIRGALSA